MKKVDLLDIDSAMLKDLELVAAKDPISRDLDGEAVVLNMTSGVYCGLNEVGARIWQLIQEPIHIDRLCETLLSEYDVETQRCKDDVLKLLQQMAAKGLIDIKIGKNS